MARVTIVGNDKDTQQTLGNEETNADKNRADDPERIVTRREEKLGEWLDRER